MCVWAQWEGSVCVCGEGGYWRQPGRSVGGCRCRLSPDTTVKTLKRLGVISDRSSSLKTDYSRILPAKSCQGDSVMQDYDPINTSLNHSLSRRSWWGLGFIFRWHWSAAAVSRRIEDKSEDWESLRFPRVLELLGVPERKTWRKLEWVVCDVGEMLEGSPLYQWVC